MRVSAAQLQYNRLVRGWYREPVPRYWLSCPAVDEPTSSTRSRVRFDRFISVPGVRRVCPAGSDAIRTSVHQQDDSVRRTPLPINDHPEASANYTLTRIKGRDFYVLPGT